MVIERGQALFVSPQISQAFDLCFDAIIGLTDWPTALQHLGRTLKADSAVLMPCAQDFTTRHRVQIESSEHAGFSALWLARLEDPLSDPHSTRARRFPVSSCPFVTDHQITTESERAGLPYFNEVARPGGRDWWAILRAGNDRQAWCLNLYRGRRAGPFGASDAERASQAAPLLRRMTATAERFAGAGWDARLHSFDQLRLAAFLVDVRAQVLGMNRAGEALLGRGISLVRGRLAVSGLGAQATFAQFLGGIGTATEPPDPVMLRNENDRCWLVEYVPVSSRAVEVFHGAKGLILVSDIKRQTPLRPGILQETFGFTQAEERLALVLADGRGLGPAAIALQVGVETARSQLHAIFDKTGARSQAQLSALLTRMAERLQAPTSPPNG